MESHHKTRELLAKALAESGQCANDLLRKVIFPQIQDSGVPTHSSTITALANASIAVKTMMMQAALKNAFAVMNPAKTQTNTGCGSQLATTSIID